MRELIVDNFAGGGGASTGIEMATGHSVDIAINHDPAAIAMHEVNHPSTMHYQEDVWQVDPRVLSAGRPVALNWLSPSCTHFSVAAGGTPKNKQMRGQAWVAVRWAATVRPRVQILENVKEFQTWGPLLKDGQPDPKRKGLTFNTFVNALRRQGYNVETNVLKACDYGAPTSRERFFMIMRRDRQQIVWPKPTHGDPNSQEVKSGLLLPWRPASECIDWSIPVPSIFGRKKELAENTKRRIARGLQKFVIEAENPFIVPGGVGFISRIGQTGFGGDKLNYSLGAPLTTITSKNEHLLVTAFLQQYYTSDSVRGQQLDQPIMTIPTENRFGLVAAYISKFRGDNIGQSLESPLQTISAGGNHHALVQAFLIAYYGSGVGQSLNDPMNTIVSRDRFGLVYVHGTPYQIIDIGMRMLEPHELFAGNGFPPNYILNRDAYGNVYSKKAQVARCGNSVPPQFSEALVRANLPEICTGAGKVLTFERYKQLEAGQLALSI